MLSDKLLFASLSWARPVHFAPNCRMQARFEIGSDFWEEDSEWERGGCWQRVLGFAKYAVVWFLWSFLHLLTIWILLLLWVLLITLF